MASSGDKWIQAFVRRVRDLVYGAAEKLLRMWGYDILASAWNRPPVLGTWGRAEQFLPLPTENETFEIIAQHGLVAISAGGVPRLELNDRILGFFAGRGDWTCVSGAFDHIYGIGEEYVDACTSANFPGLKRYRWPFEVPLSSPAPLGVLGQPFTISNWANDPTMNPAKYSGLMRAAIQARQMFAPVTDLLPKGVAGFPSYDPRWFGIARVRSIGTSLCYWLIYAGPAGVWAVQLLIPTFANLAARQVMMNLVGEDSIARYETIVFTSLYLPPSPFVPTVIKLIDQNDPGNKPFLNGAWPIAHGVKWNSDGTKAKIVTTRQAPGATTGDYWEETGEYELVINFDATCAPTLATWSQTGGGDWASATALSRLMTCALGQAGVYPKFLSNNVVADRGSGVPVYCVAYDAPTAVTYHSAGSAAIPITPTNKVYAPGGFYGSGTDAKVYYQSMSGSQEGGYMFSDLISYAHLFTNRTRVRLSFSVKGGGTPIEEVSCRNDVTGTELLSPWGSGSNKSNKRTWSTGSAEASEIIETGAHGSTITGIVIPESDAEAIVLGEYSDQTSGSRRTLKFSTSPIAVSMKSETVQSCGNVDGDPNTPCIVHSAHSSTVFQEKANWRVRDPSWTGGRLLKDLYTAGPKITSCAWCKMTVGTYLCGVRSGSIVSGLPSGWQSDNTAPITSGQDGIYKIWTPRHSFTLSENASDWSDLVLGNAFSAPGVIDSAFGTSLVYQEKAGGPLIAEGGENIGADALLRFVGWA